MHHALQPDVLLIGIFPLMPCESFDFVVLLELQNQNNGYTFTHNGF